MSVSTKLSVKFLTEIKKFPKNDKGYIQAPDSYKDTVWKTFERLHGHGYSAELMDELMKKYCAEHPSPSEAYTMDDIIKHFGVTPSGVQKPKKVHDPNNLLEPNKFYYHPVLQIAPPPPVVRMNEDGTFTASYEEDSSFFLEMKEKFTVEDLVEHFYKKFPYIRKNVRRDKGGFEYLLKSSELDVILYSIEEAMMDENPIRSVLDLDHYVSEAEAVLADRKNTLYEVGLDHVIPR